MGCKACNMGMPCNGGGCGDCFGRGMPGWGKGQKPQAIPGGAVPVMGGGGGMAAALAAQLGVPIQAVQNAFAQIPAAGTAGDPCYPPGVCLNPNFIPADPWAVDVTDPCSAEYCAQFVNDTYTILDADLSPGDILPTGWIGVLLEPITCRLCWKITVSSLVVPNGNDIPTTLRVYCPEIRRDPISGAPVVVARRKSNNITRLTFKDGRCECAELVCCVPTRVPLLVAIPAAAGDITSIELNVDRCPCPEEGDLCASLAAVCPPFAAIDYSLATGTSSTFTIVGPNG